MASSPPPGKGKGKRRSLQDTSTISESQILPPRPKASPKPDDNDDNDDTTTSNNDNASPAESDNDSPPADQDGPELPLSMSTSFLLTSTSALPTDARSALAQLSEQLDPPTHKVAIRFHAIGSAPPLKQKVFKISASSKFGSVVGFLRKKLGLVVGAAGAGEGDGKGLRPGQVGGLFCYVNSVFAPGLDEGVGNLWRCFKTDETLIVAYSITPAFG